jgi:phenylalanyl-tRNA synthetase beta chain
MGMRTEASGRFEKGLNCENNMAALIRACQLVEELGAGEIIGGIIDAYPEKKQHRVLKLDAQRIASFIGADIPEEFMRKTLVDLGFELNGDDVIVPFWRDDVEGIADLAEEVARYYGYDRIPTTLFAGVATKGGLNPKQTFEHMLSDACMSIGFTEAKTLSFMSGKAFDKIAMAKDDPRRAALVITNPLGEDQSMMRTTALPAMLETVSRNYNYRATSLRLFEQACIYLPKVVDGKADANQLPDERKILTMALYDGDFFTMKGCLESILCDMNIQNVRFIPCKTNPSYHPGRCAEIYCQDQLIGYTGQVLPVVLANYDIGT